MPIKTYNVEIEQERGHWVVHVNGVFFCTADTFMEAVREVESVYEF